MEREIWLTLLTWMEDESKMSTSHCSAATISEKNKIKPTPSLYRLELVFVVDRV